MKALNSLIFIIVVLALLGGVGTFFPEEGVSIGSRKLYFPSIENIFADDSHSTEVFQRLQAIEEGLQQQRYQDSLYVDSLSLYTNFFEGSPTRIYLPDNDWNYFNDFFADLENCHRNGKIVRILHYGDSQIESDRITGYIRQRLQEKFGGYGPGLLPAVQPIPSYTVGQSASENIERYIVSGMHQNRAPHRRYGAMGQFGTINGSGFISVNARNWKNNYENVREFQTIRLFVGNAKNFKAQLTSPLKETVKETLAEDASPVRVYTWDLPAPVNKFSLRMSGSGEVYGIAADGTSGVAVDNIPFRGSSGTFFSMLDAGVMTSMLKQLNVRLIMLEFGGNMIPVTRNEKIVRDYRNKMSEQIAYLKKVCPEAKILMIGPSDISTKVNGRLTTYPYLPLLVEALKEAALENGVAFWNMYEVMGGHNSMIEWVRHSPALAAPDYIHFTAKGTERIAGLFCETLMVYYDYYRFTTSKMCPAQYN